MHCSVMGHEALENALSHYFGEETADSKKDKMICTCFSVTESQILGAIKENGLKTVEEITNYTKAGGGCGHCKGDIQEILDKYYHKLPQVEKQQMTHTQKILKINNIIENQISPELRKDGGDIEFVDLDGNKILVKLSGSCSGCKNATLTLKNFVETTLREHFDENIEVVEV